MNIPTGGSAKSTGSLPQGDLAHHARDDGSAKGENSMHAAQSKKTVALTVRPQAYPDPPGDLSQDAAALWHQIHSKWVLDDARCAILRQALYSLDRAEQARKRLNEVGLVVTDRYAKVRPD